MTVTLPASEDQEPGPTCSFRSTSDCPLRVPSCADIGAALNELWRLMVSSPLPNAAFAAQVDGIRYPAMALRGRPPRRPFARELAAFRWLVRLPTSAAAVTRLTFDRA